ncbi:MAG TPA: UbiA family prenyltransferase [Actinoplanes sp.]|nr:UbiA family prenyltransferase [Actinoplanes sp.]
MIDLVRAPAALSVPGDVVAGASSARVLSARTLGLACSSVCLYWAGMAANDWADRDLDAVERPERPIPSGRISPRAAVGVAAGLTVAGLVAAGLAGGRRALAVAGPLAAAVWTYDLWLKNTGAGPMGMALCRALDVLLGASPGRVRRALPAAGAVAVHTYTVTELSRREVSGAEPRLAAATLGVTAALAGAVAATRRGDSSGCSEQSAMRGVPGGDSDGCSEQGRGAPGGDSDRYSEQSAVKGLVVAALAAGYAFRYGRAQTAVIKDAAAPTVRAAVGAGITALPSLQGALAARHGQAWAGLAVAAAAPAAKALARKVSPT